MQNIKNSAILIFGTHTEMNLVELAGYSLIVVSKLKKDSKVSDLPSNFFTTFWFILQYIQSNNRGEKFSKSIFKVNLTLKASSGFHYNSESLTHTLS